MPELSAKELPKQAYPIIIWQPILSDMVRQATVIAWPGNGQAMMQAIGNHVGSWHSLGQFVAVAVDIRENLVKSGSAVSRLHLISQTA